MSGGENSVMERVIWCLGLRAGSRAAAAAVAVDVAVAVAVAVVVAAGAEAALSEEVPWPLPLLLPDEELLMPAAVDNAAIDAAVGSSKRAADMVSPC